MLMKIYIIIAKNDDHPTIMIVLSNDNLYDLHAHNHDCIRRMVVRMVGR